MNLYAIAQNIEASALGQAIRESTWLFPAIEATHLLALAMLGGSVLIIALAVLGVGLKVAPAELHKSARRYMNAAVITLLITGILLGVSEPVKLYGRQAFWVKMTSLLIALAITYFAFNPLVRRGENDGVVRSVAVATMAAWLMVAMAGRWIGFS
jgi:Ca2+/Na+ antiporter